MCPPRHVPFTKGVGPYEQHSSQSVGVGIPGVKGPEKPQSAFLGLVVEGPRRQGTLCWGQSSNRLGGLRSPAGLPFNLSSVHHKRAFGGAPLRLSSEAEGDAGVPVTPAGAGAPLGARWPVRARPPPRRKAAGAVWARA